MARARSEHRCRECGWSTARWVGRCGDCGAWGTVELVAPVAASGRSTGLVSGPALPMREVDVESAVARPTGLDEFDRVLGGGLVPGSVVLLAGEPGIGKSTLLLEVAARSASAGHRALVITGEESASAVRLRAERIGAVSDHVLLAAESRLSAVLSHVEQVSPGLLVVDSVQTISGESDLAAGGPAMVREVTAALIATAKARTMTVVLVGHVTKDGSIAGPRTLEHLVDVVLQVEGDRHGRVRLVRAVKNRYGPADELGCFELADDGIWAVPDPSGLFLTRRAEPVPGTCVTVCAEGSRPLLAEVQALVAPGRTARTVHGVPAGRVSMVLAVLDRRCGIALAETDLYVATVGGLRLADPGLDLAVALAVASAAEDRALRPGLVALGEIGLAGELRPVPGTARRLTEAARVGFTHAIVPREGVPAPAALPEGMRVLPADTLAEALAAVRPRTPS